jgi:hypothetical protein
MSGLPDRPDLDQLRRQARELLRAAAAGEPPAADRLCAVSPRVTLSAAQLALAREYGFQSWTALKAEVARRRPPATPADRWSFGGAAVLQTPAGMLLPQILIAGSGQAILHGSLTLPENGQLAAAVPRRRVPAPGALLARLVPRRNARATRARRAEARAAMENIRALTRVTVVDDHGARYALRGGGASGKRGAPDRLVHLRVDPVPGRETGWIEMQGQDGTTARLRPSPRVAARIGQLRAAQVTAARRLGMPGAAPRADGPRLYRDIGVALPAVDGVSIHLDSLISLPGSWQLYLRARPRWRNYRRAGQHEKDPVSVHAEDDRGGSYRGSYAKNTGLPSEGDLAEEPIMEREELALQFLPRLDPLARSLKLTFQGASEEIAVDLEIGTARPGQDRRGG